MIRATCVKLDIGRKYGNINGVILYTVYLRIYGDGGLIDFKEKAQTLFALF